MHLRTTAVCIVKVGTFTIKTFPNTGDLLRGMRIRGPALQAEVH